MVIALGVDTGGTFTDAVLIRDEKDVIASAKALTTRSDLAVGVGQAVESVLQASGVSPSDILLASLSTTLATNALVEGQGGRVALVYIGFREDDVERHGLTEALAGDPVLVLEGGHTHSGTEACPLDLDALRPFVEKYKGEVSGFAVAGMFSTRNPGHEQQVAEFVQQQTGLPVSCSYQLSAKLNGPKRAVTAVLNARLIGMIDALIGRAEDTLKRIGISAQMMVVRGDGSLMSCQAARLRPIETILSGPAASIVGARWLTKADTALVSDIGGTTTDVALIRDGKPMLDPNGARVGAHRTMVEAVAMRTTGLGGDSQVNVVSTGLNGGVTLGPRRVLPISLIAHECPEIVHSALDASLNAPIVSELSGQFVRKVHDHTAVGLPEKEHAFLQRLSDQVQPLPDVLRTRMDHAVLKRLWERGLVQIAAVTPTDACHVLGRQQSWDCEAAAKALSLMARRRVGTGDMLAGSGPVLAQMILDQMTEQTVEALLETALHEDPAFDGQVDTVVHHPLMALGLRGYRGLLSLNAALNVDIVGLGASASTYYPAVGKRLNTTLMLPEHGDVANAIGAVVGRVSARCQSTISCPAEGVFRVHLSSAPKDFGTVQAAQDYLEAQLINDARHQIEVHGAEEVNISISRDIRTASVEDREIFIEAFITVEATARPRITST